MQIIADCHDSGVKGGILAIHAGKLQESCIIRAGARLRICRSWEHGRDVIHDTCV